MEFFQTLHRLLSTHDLREKAEGVDRLLDYCSTRSPKAPEGFEPERFAEPSYAPICRIVPPRELPRRKGFSTPEGLAVLVHAIVHIEYSAIDLALDAVYRFGSVMPVEFSVDWLEVAREEIRHFEMLERILKNLGSHYGAYPVHRGLFDAARHTDGDVLERMAVIPRHYEATGLDVNPQIMEKLRPHAAKSSDAAELLEALELIYREEIDHVRKGDRWFRYCCTQRGLDPAETFAGILRRYALLKKDRGRLNISARMEAGFHCPDLRVLGVKDCED